MDLKTIILIVTIFLLIIAGMISYTFIRKSELQHLEVTADINVSVGAAING